MNGELMVSVASEGGSQWLPGTHSHVHVHTLVHVCINLFSFRKQDFGGAAEETLVV